MYISFEKSFLRGCIKQGNLSIFYQKASDEHQKASDAHQKTSDVHQKASDGKYIAT